MKLTIDGVTDSIAGHLKSLITIHGDKISYATAQEHFIKADHQLKLASFEQIRWKIQHDKKVAEEPLPPKPTTEKRTGPRTIPEGKKEDKAEVYLTPVPENVGKLKQVEETQRNELAFDILKLLLKEIDLATASREQRQNAPMHYALFAKDCADCMLAVLEQTPGAN